MARRRVGAGACRIIADQSGLGEALALLADSAYAEKLKDCASLRAAERAIHESILWQLRVLAGWLPAGGTRLLRAVAGVYELDNIVTLTRRLAGDERGLEPFDLGALATAWPVLRSASSVGELYGALRSSPWGDPGVSADTGLAGTPNLREILTMVWLRRLADAAPAARDDASAACVLIVARITLVDRAELSPRLRQLARPLLGFGWESANTLAELLHSLPPALRPVFRGVQDVEELWRADAALRSKVETDGMRLVRGAMPGPDVVLGSIAVLAMDAWRIRAALASASSGAGPSEVLDVVA
jgi:hypothetical protein